MTARGRVNASADWDPMADDYNNTSFDAQYDDDSSNRVELDHTKLYVTNLPRGLSEDGLKTVFEKYGTVLKCFISKNPQKKFAMIFFETAAEARIAMMKLNRVGPLNLTVYIAHKSKVTTDNNKNTTRTESRSNRDEDSQRSYRERNHVNQSGSVTSRRSRNLEEANNEVLEYQLAEDLNVDIDKELHMELESIKLEKLKLKEEQLMCKQKMLLLQQNEKRLMISNNTNTSASNRRILPDGRIIVQGMPEKSQEADASFTAGGGDSSTIPGLQSVGARGCIVCGALADLYCSGCGVAPYCSERCQRRDWQQRHSALCHNLLRLTKVGAMTSAVDLPVDAKKEIEKIPQAAPLRRPHSSPKRNQQFARENFTEKKSVASRLVVRDNQPAPRRPNNPENTRNGTHNGDFVKESKPKPARDHSSRDVKHEEKNIPTPKQSPRDANKEENTKIAPKQLPATQNSALEQVKVKRVPEKYMVETLPVGESIALTVEAPAKDSNAGPGFVCFSIHEDFELSYSALLEDFAVDCDAADNSYSPAIGETYGHFDPSDSSWYRARVISDNESVLLDVGRVLPTDTSRRCVLARKYTATPEFCCVIDKAEVGASLKCTIVSKAANSCEVSVFADDETPLGAATITRWQPQIQWPAEVKKSAPIQSQPKQPTMQQKPQSQPKQLTSQPNQPMAQPTPQVKTTPEVPRPPIKNNGRYMLLDVTSLKRACVRACDDAMLFDSIIYDVAEFGLTAANLKEPPKPGQVVLGLYQEAHFRALVLKTKAKDNRYMIEYIEYGNQEIVKLEDLYECPSKFDLTNRPTLASTVQLSNKDTVELTEPAKEYIHPLKEVEEMIVTIPSGEKTAPSNSLVQLTLAKNNQSINKKLEELCTPDWKKLEEKGGDVIESRSLMFNDISQIGLPSDRSFVLHVTEYAQLREGSISGFERGAPLGDVVYGPLTDKINAYGKSGLCTESYLPKLEELCIVKMPPLRQWFRAVMVHQEGGPGAEYVQVFLLDYGNLATVPVANIRKMMPEFIKEPALANQCEIKGWPSTLTPSQLKIAEEFLCIDSEGHGTLQVTSATIDEDSNYILVAPELIAAINN